MRVFQTEKNVAVLGFGLEGKDLVNFLLKHKAQVSVYDAKEEKDLDLSGIDKKNIKLICGKNYLSSGLSKFDMVFRSPGVYRFLPEIVNAEKKGAEISSAIKFFFDLCPAKIIGVTGTKGKGTTSTLIYKILKQSGKDVYLAGNIGKAYLGLLPKLKTSSWVVLELSSFQLIDLHKSPHIAVVLNITLDHLDWHKDREEYVDAKKNIVSHQKKSDFTLLNYDFASSRGFSEYSKGKVNYFSKSEKVKGCFVDNGKIILSQDGKGYEIGDTDNLIIRGRHNWENVTASICASSIAGASIKSIKKVVFSFKGLEHRLELVSKVGGVTFYNDSFSTNPQTTIAAINSFNEQITIILGGYDKGLEYEELAQKITDKRNIKAIILIGDVAVKIKKALNNANYEGVILDLGKASMKKIVKKAFKNTTKVGVVLLSPASSSFDMFENYKDRGNQFKKEVLLLAK